MDRVELLRVLGDLKVIEPIKPAQRLVNTRVTGRVTLDGIIVCFRRLILERLAHVSSVPSSFSEAPE